MLALPGHSLAAPHSRAHGRGVRPCPCSLCLLAAAPGGCSFPVFSLSSSLSHRPRGATAPAPPAPAPCPASGEEKGPCSRYANGETPARWELRPSQPREMPVHGRKWKIPECQRLGARPAEGSPPLTPLRTPHGSRGASVAAGTRPSRHQPELSLILCNSRDSNSSSVHRNSPGRGDTGSSRE